VIATARWQEHTEQLEKPSLVPDRNVRSKVDLITGSTGKWVEDERVADEYVVAMNWGNAQGAKVLCCWHS